MVWIRLRHSNYRPYTKVAPIVRTSGSRHTGLAAPPQRNMHKTPSIEELTNKINELTSRNAEILKEVKDVNNYITCKCSHHISKLNQVIMGVIEDLDDQKESYCNIRETYTDYATKMEKIDKELAIIVYENERIITAHALFAIINKYRD